MSIISPRVKLPHLSEVVHNRSTTKLYRLFLHDHVLIKQVLRHILELHLHVVSVLWLQCSLLLCVYGLVEVCDVTK